MNDWDDALSRERQKVKNAINIKSLGSSIRKRDLELGIKKKTEKQRAAQELRSKANRATEFDNGADIPEVLQLTEDYVGNVWGNRYHNELYADYYLRLHEETGLAQYEAEAERVAHCHKSWFGDHYIMQQVFDVKTVLLCHDKFCINCQHLKQASRLKRFTPVFDELRETYDLYHLVLTVPNVPGVKLNSTLDIMYRSFKKLIRYFSGDAKIKGVDFKQYGYVGAVRGLEIVANPADYHPHIHCALLLAKDLPVRKDIVNCFSYDHGVLKRHFSNLEILIQKIWWLCLHGQKVVLDSIAGVPEGYSCTLDEVDNDEWHEVFKYVTKLTKDGEPYLSYPQFKTLYYALYRRRVMQGYGILYKLAEDDDIDEECALEYAKVIARLRRLEEPQENYGYDIDELYTDVKSNRITAISRRNIQRYLNEIAKDEEERND
ncbi:MAG: protein rep [Clostridiales bacterium]|nr:protein rep [Clostridiales bacterium]